MSDQDLWRLSAAQTAAHTTAGNITAESATAAALSRMNAVNPALNAVVEDLSTEAMDRARALDIARASGVAPGPLHGVPITIKINVDQTGHATSNGVPALKKRGGGVILNIASTAGVRPRPGLTWYNGTKGAAITLTKSMALDYAPHGIRVNAVCPAGTWTPMLRKWSSEQPDPHSIEQYLDDIHPLGNCPEGDAIADPCVFLISHMARFITGHILHVSGGAEIGYRHIGGDNHANQAG